MSDASKYDAWLSDKGPAALVIREHLMPVEGHDGVIFPATFAAAEDKKTFPGGYNIDPPPETTTTIIELDKNGNKKVTVEATLAERNVCLVDSVGSQANRIEPFFAKEGYRELVPQIVVKAGEKEVSIFEAGHRAGDALVRCSELQQTLQDAFKEVLKGNAEPLAKIAPTSLVFGVWDSRDTQAKLPRLISSTIRAYNVRKLTRSAQYVPATEYIAQGLLEDTDDKKSRDAYAERGFIHVPASGSHGGVIAEGGIRRDATLSLSALRMISAGKDEKKTLALRRYVLGIALTAFTVPVGGYLRQGCNLVNDPDKPREFVEVYVDGKRVAAKLTHDDAVAYASAAAKGFGIGASQTVDFDKSRAAADVRGDGEEKKSKKKSK